MLNPSEGRDTAMLHRLLAAALALVLASAASCQPHGVCGEWVEAHDLKGIEVRSLVATRGGVFAATDQGVFKSNDGGSTWRITNLRISTYALACTEGGVLLAGTENGVYRSDDYGETWALTGLKGKLVKALASTSGVIYAGTSEGVYVTTDGTTWKHTGLYGDVVSLAVQPGNPKVVYAGTAGGFSEKLEDLGDLYYSTDGGNSWTRYWLCNNTRLALLLGGLPLHYAVNAILANPCDPQEVYVGTGFLFTVLIIIPTEAGGIWVIKNFRILDFIRPWPFERASEGILYKGGSVNALALFGCEWLLAGMDGGVFLTTNKGRTWLKLDPENASVKAITVDAEGRIYAGRGEGLSIFYRKPLTVSLSAYAKMDGEGTLRVSGILASGSAGLPERSVKILVNGSEAAVCHTNSTGGYECTISLAASDCSNLNLTVYFPGEFCYKQSSKTLILYKVSATTEHGKVTGAGWYEAGSTATVTVYPTTVVKDIFTSYVFEGWLVNGSVVSNLPNYTFTVNKPITLTAVWRIEVNIFAICLAAVGILLIVVALAVIALTVTRKESSASQTRSP